MAISSRIAWHRTIRTKLITVILLTTSVVLGVAGYLDYKFVEHHERSHLTELAEVSAVRLAHHLAIPMWNLDREQVGDMLVAEMKESRIVAIVVRDDDNSTLFAAKERGANGEVVESVGSVAGDFITVDGKVLHGEEELGVVSLFFTAQPLLGELKRIAQGLFIELVILNIVIFIVLMLVLGRLLVNPIMDLAAGAEKISRGDLNHTFDVSARDELGYLATTFNKMQSSLRVAIRRLTKTAGA